MEEKGIRRFLMEHAEGRPVSFHMPGHKGAAFYRKNGHRKFLKNIADYDITEIPGADNLFQTEGIIKETADKYSEMYDVARSYLLINGTSGGLIAGILASVSRGGRIIMARNCHKSVFNALTLGGISPIYAYPEVVEEYGISGAVSPSEIQKLLDDNPDAEAVILPSPNYYGICSDIRSIADIVHEHGKTLIVDQAHGAHLKFFEKHGMRKPSAVLAGAVRVAPVDIRKSAEAQREYYDRHGSGQSLGEKGWSWAMPESAETCGADIVVNSIHKTLGSFTQSAVLNVTEGALEKSGGEARVDLALLEDRLQAIESTSPSYLLMASLDVNADILEKNGRRLLAEWKRNISWFYRSAVTIPELRVMTLRPKPASLMQKLPILKKLSGAADRTEGPGTGELDNTKINLDMSAYGIDGTALEKMLNDRGIFPELVTGNIVMCMTGIGNRRKDYKRLYSALAEIAFDNREALVKRAEARSILAVDDRRNGAGRNTEPAGAELWSRKRPLQPIPETAVSLPIDQCAGRVCASSIIPYPPGIPLICPGEEIGPEEITYIKRLRLQGEKVIGLSENNELMVGI